MERSLSDHSGLGTAAQALGLEPFLLAHRCPEPLVGSEGLTDKGVRGSAVTTTACATTAVTSTGTSHPQGHPQQVPTLHLQGQQCRSAQTAQEEQANCLRLGGYWKEQLLRSRKLSGDAGNICFPWSWYCRAASCPIASGTSALPELGNAAGLPLLRLLGPGAGRHTGHRVTGTGSLLTTILLSSSR